MFCFVPQALAPKGFTVTRIGGCKHPPDAPLAVPAPQSRLGCLLRCHLLDSAGLLATDDPVAWTGPCGLSVASVARDREVAPCFPAGPYARSCCCNSRCC